ncbi:uncharacterized protein BDR25DRAFT_216834 [Lindgomyces ingoldianus]|uniref:Uncharacterized protein n=1 Tax=Lindgomyces ingoldianus TaxID=673940 RepID=A0ACB6R2Y0_9PLEO|nr:uncharacterized protein BDR25DRAFT_216834 [Lindgomyces ingoldianus]KAF2473674.1 hypothetical protein BDR25DRAFT_216834 [Lindgomyces ingoldianus]
MRQGQLGLRAQFPCFYVYFPGIAPRCLGVAQGLPLRLSLHIIAITTKDKASRVLAQGVPPGVPKLYRSLADHVDVSHSTLDHRARGRHLIEEKA